MDEADKTANRRDWFLGGLAPRIRALRQLLGASGSGTDDRSDALRKEARALSETARHYGSEEVCLEAGRVLESADDDLPDSGGRLLDALVAAQAKSGDADAVILIAGCGPRFAGEVRDALGDGFPRLMHAASLDEADAIFQSVPVAVVVLLEADGNPADTLGILELIERQATALSVLYHGETIAGRARQLPCADPLAAGPEVTADPASVAAAVANRLRRARIKPRMVWRDRATGLPNREFLKTCFPNVLNGCIHDQEPLCLALIGCAPGSAESLVDTIGAITKKALRATDLAARWDAFTFAALLPGEDQFGAAKAAAKVRDAVIEVALAENVADRQSIKVAAGIALAAAGVSFDDVAASAMTQLKTSLDSADGEIAFERRLVTRRRANALVATPELLMARVLTGMLEADEFRTTVAPGLREALACCDGRRRFQLIVIDERVDAGGLQALSELKRLARNVGVPTVILLDQNSPTRPGDYRAMGAFDCFSRPLQADRFMSRIRELVSARSPFHDPSRSLFRLLLASDDPAQLYLASTALNAFGGFMVSLAKGRTDCARRLNQQVFDGVMLPASMLAEARAGRAAPSETDTLDLKDLPGILIVDAEKTLNSPLLETCAGMLTLPLDIGTLARQVETMFGLDEDRARDTPLAEQVRREVQRIADAAHHPQGEPAPWMPDDEVEPDGTAPRPEPVLNRRPRNAPEAGPAAGAPMSSSSPPARHPGTESAFDKTVSPPACELLTVELDGGVRMEFVRIEPGRILGGSPPDEEGREDDEARRTITIDAPFWLGRYPVTQEQWTALMGSNPSVFPGATNPVECVNWQDAHRFCDLLSAKIEGRAGLPTADEWEYACRAGTQTPYYAGKTAGQLGHCAWYDANSMGSTHPVGRKIPNAFGLHDMHGNVWEWCEDAFDEETDEEGSAARDADVLRVFRGGCWCSHPSLCRAAYRGCGNPLLGGYGNGFRVTIVDTPSTHCDS